MSDNDPETAGPEPRRSLFEPAPVIEHQASPATVAAPVRRRGGTPLWFTLLLTAALGGAGYYGWTHPPADAAQPSGQDPQQIQALSGRLDAMEKRDGALAGEATTALSKRVDEVSANLVGESARIAALEAQSAKNAELAAQKAPPAEPSALPADHTAQEVPGLMAQQEAASQAGTKPPSPDIKAAFDALDQRLSKLEATANAAPAAETTKPAGAADVGALGDRVAKLEQATGQADSAAKAQLVDSAALAALGDRLDKLQQSAGQSAQQADASQKAQQTGATTLATLTDRLAKLEQQAGQDAAAQKAQANDMQTVAALDARVGKLEQAAGQAEGEASGAAKDASRAIQIEVAAAALQAGQPLGQLQGAPPALARFATAPPPTEAALRADFPRVADSARAVSQPGNASRSFLDRTWARLQQSVVVRQGDHVVVGDPAAGVLARAQTSVAAGDLKSAADTLGALSGPAAEAVQPWVAQARALIDARAALAAMAAHG